MKTLSSLMFFALFTSCSGQSVETRPVIIKPAVKETKEAPAPSLKDQAAKCMCVKMWLPVCGENGVTYGNSCEANCAGVKSTLGECAKKI